MSNTQLDKKYGNDWAKSKSRDLVRSMIQRTLLIYRKPQDLKVLCFPGNDVAEIREVYDALGISRGNIVGVERDKAVAEKIRARGLGIQVVNQTLEDFVASQDSLAFDVISLDYSGPVNQSTINSLVKISQKMVLNSYLFHQANLMKRDARVTRTYVDLGTLGHFVPHASPDDTVRIIGEAFEKYDKGESSQIRSDGLTNLICSCLGPAGELDILFDFALRDRPRYRSSIIDGLQEVIRKNSGDNNFKLDPKNPMVSLLKSNNFLYTRLLVTNKVVRYLLNDLWVSFCKDETLQEVPEGLFTALALSSSKRGHNPVEFKRYSYVSESGDPMMGDISFLSNPWKLREKAKNVANQVGFPTQFKLPDLRKFISVYNEFIKESKHCPSPLRRADEREFLGSSALPVITKQRAIEEFRNGAEVEYLRVKYRGWREKPLAQWKAHVTRGTYDKSVQNSEDIIIEDVEDSDVEKITKEQAIEFLLAGIPSKEIYESYPTSFSIGQLRAFRAHITMETYK